MKIIISAIDSKGYLIDSNGENFKVIKTQDKEFKKYSRPEIAMSIMDAVKIIEKMLDNTNTESIFILKKTDAEEPKIEEEKVV